MANCPRCGAEISAEVFRTTECPSCRRPLHCCICCTFYSPNASHGCREALDEPVRDKEGANFCDHFRLSENRAGQGSDEKRRQASKEALDKLFGF